MEFKAIKLLAATALVAAGTAASAGETSFDLIPGETLPAIDVSLTLQESNNAGYDYDFVFTNSSDAGVVTGIYFGVDWTTLLSGLSTTSGPAVFESGTLDPDVDGWEDTSASFTTDVQRVRVRQGRGYVDTFVDRINDGIEESETQVFSFSTDDSISLEDLEAVLGTEGFDISIRLQGLGADETATEYALVQEFVIEQPLTVLSDTVAPDSVSVTAAPSPTAALGGLVVMGLAGLRRRRK